MVKKRRDRDYELTSKVSVQEDEGITSDDEIDTVNVDFEWFNFKPEIDFHGVRNLLRQLFDVDAPLIDLSSLTDIILSQPTIGSTIKVEGEESDPYAIMTILNLYEHREKRAIQDIIQYILKKCKSTSSLAPIIPILKSSTKIGLILSERLINVPAEVAPPLYDTLKDEIEAAIEDNEPYDFTHYLIFTKKYQEIASALDEQDAPKSKKKKTDKISRETFHFHAEDEILQSYASAFGTFNYTNDRGDGMADSKRAFSEMGIKSQGAIILIEASKFDNALKAINNFINNPK